MHTFITGGLIYDGTGAEPFIGDLVMENDRIEGIYRKGEAHRQIAEGDIVIDAAGKTVTPGFIDLHRHADLAVFRDCGPQELAQGLTTIGTGVCGFSFAPYTERSLGLDIYTAPLMGPSADGAHYPHMKDYIAAAKKAELPFNACTLQGLGAIRVAVKGYDPSPYTDAEMRKAQEFVAEACEAGVRGFSSGLIYNPEMYTSTEEIIRMLEPAKDKGLLYMPHTRNEADKLPESVDEAIRIAKECGMSLGISHFKALGPENWHGKLEKAIARIEEEQAQGMDITVDVYPYTGTATTLSSSLPYSFLTEPFEEILKKINTKAEIDRMRACYENPGPKDSLISPEFRWNTTIITGVALPENEKYIGHSVSEAAQMSGYSDLYEFLGNLLYSEEGMVCMAEMMIDPEDMKRILKLPYAMIISDSLYSLSEFSHPRAYAHIPHMIKEYVLKEKVLTMEETVYKLSLAQAKRMRYQDRGILAAGAYADVLVFDPEALGDNATFEHGKVLSTGMEYVFVNGQLAWHDEKLAARAGRYLLG